MRKNVWVTLITLITLSFGYPLNSYSDIITKDGVKIQFFKKGQKKSIPKDELLSSEGIVTPSESLLDRIVFTNVKIDYKEVSVMIYDFKKKLVMVKDRIIVSNKSITLYLYPWLDDTNQYPEEDLSEILGPGGVGEYHIVINNKNTNEKIIDITYFIYEVLVD